MRHPAQEEGQDSCCKHAQHLIITRTGAFLDVFRAQQRPSDEAVTGNDDDEGHQEAQQAFHQADGQRELPYLYSIVSFWVQNATHRPVVCNVVHIPGERCGHAQHKGKKPDDHTGDSCVQHSAEPA